MMTVLAYLVMAFSACLGVMANSGSDDTKTWGTTTSTSPAMMTGWVFVLVAVIVVAVFCGGICTAIVGGRNGRTEY
jgi:hypothetical protein